MSGSSGFRVESTSGAGSAPIVEVSSGKPSLVRETLSSDAPEGVGTSRGGATLQTVDPP